MSPCSIVISAFHFLPSPKATNPKTRRIKGDDDRHLKLNCSPKLEMVLGIPAAAADCS